MKRTIVGLTRVKDFTGWYTYVEWSDGSVERWYKASYDYDWWNEGVVPFVGY